MTDSGCRRYYYQDRNQTQRRWLWLPSLLFCCALAVQGLAVSGCSADVQEADDDHSLPLDPVARERMQKKAEEKGRKFASATGVPVVKESPVVTEERIQEPVAVSTVVPGSADGAEAGLVPQPVGVSGLPDSFRLVERSEADRSARAAHAAADAVGVPDVPQSRLLVRQPDTAETVPAAAVGPEAVAEKTAETPAGKPTEKPTEKPVEGSSEQGSPVSAAASSDASGVSDVADTAASAEAGKATEKTAE